MHDSLVDNQQLPIRSVLQACLCIKVLALQGMNQQIHLPTTDEKTLAGIFFLTLS